MMKKILIVIHDMRIGGAQKSLLSFLQCLEADEQRSAYEIHLLPLRPDGEFLNQLPPSVIVEEPGRVLRWLSCHMSANLVRQYFSLRGMLGEGLWLLRKALKWFPKALNASQKLWMSWKRLIPARKEAYDIAVAYMEGLSSYYVVDKVTAGRKVLWLHTDCEKAQYQPAFDAPYYAAADQIITISEECRETLRRNHAGQAAKMAVLPNITSYRMLKAYSEEGECPEYAGATGLKLLTVCRLTELKGIDMAIEAAEMLHAEGIEFTWLVVGEGADRERLETLLGQSGAREHFRLIGARMNPYAYMRECDILIQSSRYEGKSIVLDEAKMLCKPIVATNYATVRDAVTDGETGLIVEMTPAGIAGGIRVLYQDAKLRSYLVDNLQALPKDNTEALQQYIDLMF